MNIAYDQEEKEAAWNEFHKVAQEELATLIQSGKEDIAGAVKVRERLKKAPVVKDFKVSYTILGNKKPQDRTWKNPTLAQLQGEIPLAVKRALGYMQDAANKALHMAPTPSLRTKFWKKQVDKAQSKVAYGMMMATNSRKGRAVPMPPQGNPRPLPIASINENTNLDPKHEPGETT